MLEAMDKEQVAVNNIGSYLTVKETADRRKQEQLYKDWNNTVFQPIQDQIAAGLKARSTSEIEHRRQRAMQEYIDVTNNKDGVFRDILIPDYDPLKQRKQVLTYSTKKIEDPLKADLAKIKWEADMIDSLNPNNVRIVHQQRETLDLLLWDRLDSTPYARYAETSAEKRRPKGLSKENPKVFNESTLRVFDHYNLEKDPKVASLEYFHRGVRTDGLQYKQKLNRPWLENPVYHLKSLQDQDNTD
mmetsp:Transcript_9670/g.14106  ORF Transcript_9670/g.14106 Transcript_9670/m.14106 type:complete len:244 (+) Transcript_9670:89-820(+)